MINATLILHATCIAVEGRAVLITGSSGSGKSALALQLIALGAQLVADDRTVVKATKGVLTASPPPALEGMIEARGVGILMQPYLGQAPLSLVVDLDQIEDARLPPVYSTRILDIDLPCLHKVDAPNFQAAIHAYMTGSRNETL